MYELKFRNVMAERPLKVRVWPASECNTSHVWGWEPGSPWPPRPHPDLALPSRGEERAAYGFTGIINSQLLSKSLHFVLLLPTLQVIIFNYVIDGNHKENALYPSAYTILWGRPPHHALPFMSPPFLHSSSETADENNLQ